MNRRLRSALVIAKRQALETLLSPGLYISLSAGLALGFYLVKSFAASVDSSGFNPRLSPVYDLLERALSGAFGTAFAGALFAEGPCLLAFIVAIVPVLAFLAIASVFRFGLEKNAGAVELLAYGPADGSSYLIATFIKDFAFGLASLAITALCLATAAALGGLATGAMFLAALPISAFLSAAVFAYGVFFSIISRNAASALSLFLAFLLVLLVILAGSLSVATGSARVLAAAAAAVAGWLSPFFYATLSLRAAEEGRLWGMLAGILLMVALSGTLLFASHFLCRRRGVRP